MRKELPNKLREDRGHEYVRRETTTMAPWHCLVHHGTGASSRLKNRHFVSRRASRRPYDAPEGHLGRRPGTSSRLKNKPASQETKGALFQDAYDCGIQLHALAPRAPLLAAIRVLNAAPFAVIQRINVLFVFSRSWRDDYIIRRFTRRTCGDSRHKT